MGLRTVASRLNGAIAALVLVPRSYGSADQSGVQRAVSPSAGAVGPWKQCGGVDWKDDRGCVSGHVCVRKNTWYMECKPVDPKRKKHDEHPLWPMTFRDFGKPAKAPPSLFCFAVVVPNTFEPGLVAAQWQQEAGMFACDEYAVISNVTADRLFQKNPRAAKHIRVSLIDIDLRVSTSRGAPGLDPSSWQPNESNLHLLNTPVFLKVWDQIFREGRFRDYDFTIKLDADTVIIPGRVRELVRHHPKPGYPDDHNYAPEYLLNAPEDMYANFLHGAVEVLSKKAMEVYAKGAQRCQKEVDYSDKGEDFYLNLCLQRLGVTAISQLKVLKDADELGKERLVCDHRHATFHPARTVNQWVACLQEARVSGGLIGDLREVLADMMFKFSTTRLLDKAGRDLPMTAIGSAGLAMLVLTGGIVLVQKRRARARARLSWVIPAEGEALMGLFSPDGTSN